MPSFAFISHASADLAVANSVCAELEKRGIECWISSRDIPPGSNFGEEIASAIRASTAMVLVFSVNANRSDEIKKEVALAGRNKVALIPFKTDATVPSGAFEYELITRQWIDASSEWSGAIDRLAQRVRQSVAANDEGHHLAGSTKNGASGLSIEDALVAADKAYTNQNLGTHLELIGYAYDRGSAEAALTLSHIYNGYYPGHKKRDRKLGGQFLRIAADRGSPSAQYLMGILCYEGRGMRRNLLAAYAWMKAAAAGGDKGAKRWLLIPFWLRRIVPFGPALIGFLMIGGMVLVIRNTPPCSHPVTGREPNPVRAHAECFREMLENAFR